MAASMEQGHGFGYSQREFFVEKADSDLQIAVLGTERMTSASYPTDTSPNRRHIAFLLEAAYGAGLGVRPELRCPNTAGCSLGARQHHHTTSIRGSILWETVEQLA